MNNHFLDRKKIHKNSLSTMSTKGSVSFGKKRGKIIGNKKKKIGKKIDTKSIKKKK